MKKLLVLLLCTVLSRTLCGCYDATDITELSFVLAVGIDVGSDTFHRYTFQLVNPASFAEEGDGDYVPMSVEAPDIYTAMDLMNGAVARKYDYTHAKLLVFSEAVATQGIREQLTAMLRSADFHPNMRIAISKGEASAYLEQLRPPLAENPAAYYERVFDARNTAYAPDVLLKDFDGREGCHVVPLVGIGSAEEGPSAAYSGTVHPQPQMQAGDPFQKAETGGDILGMAILREGRMIAAAGAEEAFLYQLLAQKQMHGHYTMCLPDGHQVVIDIVKHRGGEQLRYVPTDAGAVLYVTLRLEGGIVWSDNPDGTALESRALQTLAEACITQELTAFLKRCSDDYRADILHLSDIAKKQYWTIQDWEAANWAHTYETLRYAVHTTVALRREGMNVQ